VAALVGFGCDVSTYYGEHEGGIALAQFQTGDRDGAFETLRRARAIADGLPDAKSKGMSLSLIARAMLAMGDLPGAIRLGGTIADAAASDRAQVDIAVAHAQARRWDDAMHVVDSIRDGASRLVGLCRVGVAHAKAKDPKAAQKLFSRALEIAKDLKLNGAPDPTGPYHVALAQAESGDYRGARETMRRHRVSPTPHEEIELIAGMQARGGELDRALFTLQSLPPGHSSDSTRSQMLREIVRLQVAAGKDQQIIDAAEGFDSPVCAARVLMGIAQGLNARKLAGAKADANMLPRP
jgi:tetratricopeptide (TPR) repeat protein